MKIIAPARISTADTAYRFFPSIAFSIKISIGIQQASLPAPKLLGEFKLHDRASTRAPRSLCLSKWNSLPIAFFILVDSLSKTSREGNVVDTLASIICSLRSRSLNCSGLCSQQNAYQTSRNQIEIVPHVS